ncbi:MAG: hypothetical protein GY818_22200 [Planctomycetaceae bacterium]|nr:hypothetical protein [Planctomycetaceae bacterium]
MTLDYSTSNASFNAKLSSDPIGLGSYCFTKFSETYVLISVFNTSTFADGSEGVRFAPAVMQGRQYKKCLKRLVGFFVDTAYENVDTSIFAEADNVIIRGTGLGIRFDWFLFLLISAPNSKILANTARGIIVSHWCGPCVPNPLSNNGAWANTTTATPPTPEDLDCPPPPAPGPSGAVSKDRGVYRQIDFSRQPSNTSAFLQETERAIRARQQPAVTPLRPPPITPLRQPSATPLRPIDLQLLDITAPDTPLLEAPITPACDTPLTRSVQMVRVYHMLA